MATCENVVAARHAFPAQSMPVRDRSMTLTIACREEAEYTHLLNGVGAGKDRRGGAPKSFGLCANHSPLFEQIDRELVQDAWVPAHTSKPTRL